MLRRPVVGRVLLAVLLVTGVACSGNDAPTPPAEVEGRAPPPDETLTGPLTVAAASSLTEVFDALGDEFTRRHPRAPVSFDFAGSGQVVDRLAGGARFDVVALADEVAMNRIVATRRATDPRPFARNRLAIAVRPGNPKNIRTVADLDAPGLVVALGAPGVPIGDYTRRLLDRYGVDVRPSSAEASAKAVLGKVTVGDADAGIVYASDVRAAGTRVHGLEIPEDDNVVATSFVAVATDAPHRDTARAFVAFLLSADGRRLLADFGFLPPDV